MRAHCGPGEKLTAMPIAPARPSGRSPKSKSSSAMRAPPSPWRSNADDYVPSPARRAMRPACPITPTRVKKTRCCGSVAPIAHSKRHKTSAPGKRRPSKTRARRGRPPGTHCAPALPPSGRPSHLTSKPTSPRVPPQARLGASRHRARPLHDKPSSAPSAHGKRRAHERGVTRTAGALA